MDNYSTRWSPHTLDNCSITRWSRHTDVGRLLEYSLESPVLGQLQKGHKMDAGRWFTFNIIFTIVMLGCWVWPSCCLSGEYHGDILQS